MIKARWIVGHHTIKNTVMNSLHKGDIVMKIALINENSQAAKNGIIEAALKKVVEPIR